MLQKLWITEYSGGSKISPRRGHQLSRGGANTRFCQIFPKTAWKWKNLDPGACPSRPLRSATAIQYNNTMRHKYSHIFGLNRIILRLFSKVVIELSFTCVKGNEISFLAELLLCYLTGNIFGVEISCGQCENDMWMTREWDFRQDFTDRRCLHVVRMSSAHILHVIHMSSAHHPEACMSSTRDGNSSA